MTLQIKRTIRERTRANERKVTFLIEEATEDPANVILAVGVEQVRGVHAGGLYLCHSKCLRTLRRQIIIVARRFDAPTVKIVAQIKCGFGSAESCGSGRPKSPF